MADEDLSTHWEETEGQAAKETAAATNNHFWWDTDGAHVSSTGDHDTSGFHQLMTSVKNAFMHGSTELMTISENLIELGKNSTSAVISMCAGRLRIAFEPLLAADRTLSAVISSEKPLGLKSDYGSSVVYSHTVTEADVEHGEPAPLGTQLESRLYASVGDDALGSMVGIYMRTKTPQGSSQVAQVLLRDGIAGTSGGPTIEVITPNVDTSASFDRLATVLGDSGWIWLIGPYGSEQLGCCYRLKAGMVTVSVSLSDDSAINVGGGGTILGTLPSAYRPASDQIAAASLRGANGAGQLNVQADGIVRAFNFAGGSIYFAASLCYPL